MTFARVGDQLVNNHLIQERFESLLIKRGTKANNTVLNREKTLTLK